MTGDMKPGQSEVNAEASRAGPIKTSGDALDIAVDALRSRLQASAGGRMDAGRVDARVSGIGSKPARHPPLSEEAISRKISLVSSK